MQTILAEAFEDSGRRSMEELFRGLGVALPYVGPGGPIQVGPRHVGGLIGFTGKRARGQILIVSTFELVARTRPAAIARPLSSAVSRDWLLVRDWMGELSNRLLGRIKNRLLPAGVDFRVATPLALSGQGLTAAVHPRVKPRVMAFGHGVDAAWLVVSLVEEPEGASTGAPIVRDGALREGDVVEF